MRRSCSQRLYEAYRCEIRSLVPKAVTDKLLGRLEIALDASIAGKRIDAEENLDRPIDYRSFDCSPRIARRIAHSLLNSGIKSYRELLDYSKRDLGEEKNIGKQALEIIGRHLKERRYALRD